MNQAARIQSAIDSGAIKKIVVIDDAFDPPVLGDEDAGDFLELLEDADRAKLLKRAGITEEEIANAITAITSSEYQDDALKAVVSKLYGKYVEKFDEKFDPANRFTVLKGDNLRRIRPLLKLFAKCSKVAVTRIGSDTSTVDFAALNPDAIFVDYYLDPTLSPTAVPDQEKGLAARRDSLAVVRQVLQAKPGKGPSIMLMSSHSVKNEARAFRREILDEKKVFASRFHFLSKEGLDEEQDGSITVADEAADALLDIAQRHVFAAAVEECLTQWKAGVEEAQKNIWDLITDIELKDFAYLARFRLLDEGQSLTSYLEWFFGEVMVDEVARTVDWKHKSFATLDEGAEKNKPGSQIEGAFDGPTTRIADLYFRARVDSRTSRQGVELRTGDLYAHKDRPNELLATVTPDCDLMVRRKRRSAKRLTVVAGSLQRIDAPDSSIADFFVQGKKAVNIVWDSKDIRTIEYSEVEDGTYKLLGALRPLYAYELQRRVLSDLGRIGLAVAPAMAMSGQSKVLVQQVDSEPVELALPRPNSASCAVIPKRGATDKARIVYHRSFATALLDALLALPEANQSQQTAKALNVLKQPKCQMQFIDKLCRDGQFDGDEAFGVLTSLQLERKGGTAWCQILVTHQPEQTEDIPEAEEAAA